MPGNLLMMTAGTYIRLGRERRDWSLEDLAERLRTDPHVPARRLIDWLAAIEADRSASTRMPPLRSSTCWGSTC